MQNELVEKIVAQKLHCVFISPHFDDALLSCGSLIAQLSGKVDITIINVFTKAHDKPYTLSTRKFLMDSKIADAEKLYEERRKEDEKAFSTFKIKIRNLDLEDALFRKKEEKTILGNIIPEFNHLYPTYKWHITKKIAPHDPAVTILEKHLQQFVKDSFLVFAPFGIGNHADHKIARIVSEKVFKRFILYSDFPYNVRLNTFGVAFKNGATFRLDPDMQVKEKLIKTYKTQFRGLFPNGIIPAHQEIYFSNKTL